MNVIKTLNVIRRMAPIPFLLYLFLSLYGIKMTLDLFVYINTTYRIYFEITKKKF
jgi:hypothetical protein